jgi:hypothetical protein
VNIACGAESKDPDGAYLTHAARTFSTTEAREQDLLRCTRLHPRLRVRLSVRNPHEVRQRHQGPQEIRGSAVGVALRRDAERFEL